MLVDVAGCGGSGAQTRTVCGQGGRATSCGSAPLPEADNEGRGKRRCFLCVCVGTVGSDVSCPSCALEILVGHRGGQVNHAGLARVWREMLKGSARYTDAGDVSEVEVTEHTPRRAGSQFHARRGLKLWQVKFLGRWSGNTVEKYAGEAFADIRAGRSMGSGTSAVPKVHRRSVDDTQLWEITAQLQELTAQEVAVVSNRGGSIGLGGGSRGPLVR